LHAVNNCRFYEPSLVAGSYTIKVNQDVTLADDKLPRALNLGPDPKAPINIQEQSFEVVGPRFVIDPKDIHSVYPPQGHADQPNILPHVVMNDAHLPWARRVKPPSDDEDDIIPWLALFPFDCNGPTQELRLTVDQLTALSTALKTKDALMQSSAFTVPMTVKDYLALPSTLPKIGNANIIIPAFNTLSKGDDASKKEYSEISTDTTPVEVIFLSGKLFKSIMPLSTTASTDKKTWNVDQYRFCAHVRNVNTAGMTASGLDDTGLFGILHSRRTGPTGIKVVFFSISKNSHALTAAQILLKILLPDRKLCT
jgi:hypothetical protein